ncbi:MAG TPA: hypothetical protein VIC08_11235 [Cellvibrionaceae bacterium]
MRIVFFALLGINVAALVLQLTVWRVEATIPQVSAPGRADASLRLLSESDVSVDMVSDRSSSPLLAAREGESLCVVVGPFEALLRGEYFVEALQALEVGAEVRELEVPEGEGFWVYLPSEPTRKEALERLREVQAKNIDSYLIPRGELANGISLGMFTREELALEQQQQMREQGFAATIKTITRMRSEIWVLVDREDAQKLNRETWVRLLNRENDIEKLQKYCEGVAPAGKFL